MWEVRAHHCGDTEENNVRLWLQTHARLGKYDNKWILKRDKSEQFFSDFLSGSLGDSASQRQKHNNLTVNVSVQSGCLPLAWINIANILPQVTTKADLLGESKTTRSDEDEVSRSPSFSAIASLTPLRRTANTPEGEGSRLKLYLIIPAALLGLVILVIAIFLVSKVRHFANRRLC